MLVHTLLSMVAYSCLAGYWFWNERAFWALFGMSKVYAAQVDPGVALITAQAIMGDLFVVVFGLLALAGVQSFKP